ncbi:MAG: UDP-3-O-(3-hydroxymyristoyl)glucosamine N-acyltransferase, partial [Aquificota bacterium]
MKLSELALLVGGELRGDPDYQVVGISSPQKPKERTVVFCQSKK